MAAESLCWPADPSRCVWRKPALWCPSLPLDHSPDALTDAWSWAGDKQLETERKCELKSFDSGGKQLLKKQFLLVPTSRHQGNVTSILRCAGVKPMTLVHISVNCPFMTSYSFANGHSFLWQGLWVRDVVLHDGLEELVLVFSIKRRLKRQNAESDSVTKNIE